jgi:hypothetical protein
LERDIGTDVRAHRILLPKDQTIINNTQLQYKAYLNSSPATLRVGSFKCLSIVYIPYHLINI